MNKKLYELERNGQTFKVYCKREQYIKGDDLAIWLYLEDGEPFARLTVNLHDDLCSGYAYVDTNNRPWAAEFIEKNGLGERTEILGRSGRCEYPLYKFFVEKLT